MTNEKPTKPISTLFAAPRAYGKLDISNELIICRVENGRLIPHPAVEMRDRGGYIMHGHRTAYPSSWEEGVLAVGTAEERKRELEKLAKARAEWNDYQVKKDAWQNEYGVPPFTQYQRNTTSALGKQQWAEYDAFMLGKPPYPKQPFGVSYPGQSDPPALLMMGLNDDRSAYEAVYDPHDQAGLIDNLMLLNFRRKV